MATYNYSYTFSFEDNFSEPKFAQYMDKHWADSFIYAFVYVILVFGGKRYMEKRPKYELRPWLATWSGVLAVFSIFGAARTLPELIGVIQQNGLEYSVCIPSYLDSAAGLWACLFTVSKVYELGDTIFIVLRKQPLIFLHWYHHITVLVYVWYSYPDRTAAGRWFMVMNYVVHSIMYSYYTLRAMRYRLPRWVSMFITTLQLVQMIIGCSLNVWAYQIKQDGRFCRQSYENIRYSVMMYTSYFILFAHFFYTTYVVQKPRDVKKAE
ncbi:hypothetical protein FSP39_022848 [Pinctada imbricata]|uniref:Elongation of very long chain fatty acids protein n=1 Tax=Pinctada imbricata TaxID=66713 RepID=A0AA88Y155_PINIB|nr:hypothetical protein FSP39_022848 [Pinctada imbricata]